MERKKKKKCERIRNTDFATKKYLPVSRKLDGVDPVDNRPSTN